MKRDARLRQLSSDHHHALVLAKRATAGEMSADEVRARFDAELAPHFAIEEEILLPALREAGAAELADRTAADHAAIRAALDADALGDFAERLTAHVRFEERELFPISEEQLPGSVLDAIEARTPR